MNKSFIVIGLLAGIFAVGSSMAADSSDKKIDRDTRQLKKDYDAKVHKDLKGIGTRIDQFKRDVSKGGKDVQKDLGHEVRKLDAQKAVVDKKLVELEKSTGDAWKDMSRGVDDAVADLKKSVDNAVAQFREKHPT